MHAQAGRLAEAEAAYRNIIASYPKFHPAYQELGLLVYAAGNLAMAAELFKAAIALDKNNALYYRNYGEICRRLGRFDEATEAGKQACQAIPTRYQRPFQFRIGLLRCEGLRRRDSCI